MGAADAVHVEDILRRARARGASDVHCAGGERPALRIDGDLVPLDFAPVADDGLRAFLRTMLPVDALERLAEHGAADGALRHAEFGPLRIQAIRHLSGLRVVVRLLPKSIPALETLGLPPAFPALIARPMGLLLFTGPTGCGKTTVTAAAIDAINRTSARTILTVEDPVEFVHTPIRSVITHCEIRRDVADYGAALRTFLRCDPDVILVGEVRDRATMEATITAAETGHLVIATLHTNDAAQTVDRIVDSFPSPAQQQVRTQLAHVLLAVVAMRLVPRRAGGRTLAAEIMLATDGVKALIREGKSHQLHNAIATGRGAGMQTLEAHLSDHVRRGTITYDAALAAANRPHDVRALGTTAAC